MEIQKQQDAGGSKFHSVGKRRFFGKLMESRIAEKMRGCANNASYIGRDCADAARYFAAYCVINARHPVKTYWAWRYCRLFEKSASVKLKTDEFIHSKQDDDDYGLRINTLKGVFEHFHLIRYHRLFDTPLRRFMGTEKICSKVAALGMFSLLEAGVESQTEDLSLFSLRALTNAGEFGFAERLLFDKAYDAFLAPKEPAITRKEVLWGIAEGRNFGMIEKFLESLPESERGEWIGEVAHIASAVLYRNRQFYAPIPKKLMPVVQDYVQTSKYKDEISAAINRD